MPIRSPRSSSGESNHASSPEGILSDSLFQENALDTTIAQEIWEAVRKDFDDRKALISLLVEKLKDGRLSKEKQTGPRMFHTGMDFSKLMTKITPAPALALIHNTLGDLRFRSVSRPIRVERSTRKRRATVPTDADLIAICGEGPGTRKWRAAPNEWICPTCDRSKREVVRKSNTKEWFAAIFSHTEWCIRPGCTKAEIETFYVDHHHVISVCGDCHAVMRDLRARTSDNDVYSSFLTGEQLRQVVDATPHAPHLVDWEKAAFFAAENSRWNDAIEEYGEVYRYAMSVKDSFERLRGLHRTSHDDTIAIIADDRRSEFPPEWSFAEVQGYLEDLLEKATMWNECVSTSFP